MTNEELIDALRNCACIKNEDHCKICGYRHSTECGRRIAEDAADALEADEKRIAELMPKEGEWIEQDDGNSIYHKCSVCGKNQYNVLLEMMQGDYHYCPNCGARMKGENDEQD